LFSVRYNILALILINVKLIGFGINIEKDFENFLYTGPVSWVFLYITVLKYFISTTQCEQSNALCFTASLISEVQMRANFEKTYHSFATTVLQLTISDFSSEKFKGFKVLYVSMSARTTQMLSSGEFYKLRYDTTSIPVKSAHSNVSFYTNNSKMPNFVVVTLFSQFSDM
jgi:hypothetical protein